MRIKFSSHRILGSRGLTQLLEAGHVDVVVTEQRIRILQVYLVEFLVMSSLQQLGHLGTVGAPSVGSVLPLPHHNIAPIG